MTKLKDFLKLCDDEVEIAFGYYTSGGAFVFEDTFITLHCIKTFVINPDLLQMPVTSIITHNNVIRIYIDRREVE